MAEPISGASVHRLSMSRRSMLAGSASALAAPALVVPAFAALPAPAGGADPDAVLLLRLGLRAARQGHARVFEYEDRDWLARAIADLERIGEGRRTF